MNVALDGSLTEGLAGHLLPLMFTIDQGQHELSLLVAEGLALPSQLTVHVLGLIRHVPVLICGSSPHATGCLPEIECGVKLRFAEILGHLQLVLILLLLSTELDEHVSSLPLGHHVSPLSRVLSLANNLSLLVDAGQIVVHAPHSHELFLKNLLLVNEVFPRLHNHAIDLLTSTLRVLHELELLVDLVVEVLLELDVEQLVIAELLFTHLQGLLELKLLLQGLVGNLIV